MILVHICHLTEATSVTEAPEDVTNCEDNHHLRQGRHVHLNRVAVAAPGSDYSLIKLRVSSVLQCKLLSEIQAPVAFQINPSNVYPDPKQSDDNQAQQKRSSSLEAFEGKAQQKKWSAAVTSGGKARNPMMFARGLFSQWTC